METGPSHLDTKSQFCVTDNGLVSPQVEKISTIIYLFYSSCKSIFFTVYKGLYNKGLIKLKILYETTSNSAKLLEQNYKGGINI